MLVQEAGETSARSKSLTLQHQAGPPSESPAHPLLTSLTPFRRMFSDSWISQTRGKNQGLT